MAKNCGFTLGGKGTDMAEDLEEIKERLEQLERYVNLLETRVDLQGSLMVPYSAGREPVALPDTENAQASAREAEDPRPSGDDPELKGFNYLLRTILTQQGMHNTDVRKAVRSQEGLRSTMGKAIGTLNSIEQMLRDIPRKVQTLVNEREAR